MAEASLTFDVLARDRASATFNRIGRNTDTLSRRMGSLARTARIALGGFAAFEAAKAIRGIASIGIAYQDSLNVFQSVSRATAEQMDAVANRAKELGANLKLPTTSAADAAAAMTELAKGGLNVKESMQAALGTLQLATAAQVDGAEAAKIQSAALAQFGLGAKSAGHVADLLAGAANAAQGEITDMATALTYIGPVARAAGITVDETAVAITALAKQGILGQKAGTGLRGVLTSLTKPSTEGADALKALGVNAYDATGNFVGFQKVAEQLATAQTKFTRQGFGNAVAAAFGRQQLAAVNALAATGTKQFDGYTKALANKNNVERVSESRSRGLGGALRGLQSQMETLAISIYQKVAPGLEQIVQGASARLPGFIDQVKAAFQRARPDLEEFARNTVKFGRALVHALESLKPFAEFVAKVLVGAFRTLSHVMGRLGDAPELVKKITRLVIIGGAAWKTYTYWARAAAAASLAAGGGAGAKGAGGAAGRGGIFAAAAAGTAKLIRMARAVRGTGAAWLGLGRAASLSGALIIGASQDTASATQLNSDAIRFSISDYLKYTEQLKTATGAERARLLQLRRLTEGFLEANHVTTVNGRVLENLAGKLYGLPGLFAAAAQGARDFTTALRGGGKDASYGNFTDPGHPGYVPPTTGKTGGGNKSSVTTGTQTYSYKAGKDAGKSMADGVAKGLSAAATKAISAAKSMVDKITQQFKALKDKARQLAQSITQAVTGAADLSNISQTDSLGAAFAPSVAGIKDFLHAQLKKDREFRRLLKQERARGLSQSLYRQLALAGPDAAGPIVQALAGASRADLRDISRTNRLIGGVGQGLGRSVSQDVYGEQLKAQAKLQKDANSLLRDLVREAHDDSLTKNDLHGLGRQFRRAIHHEKVVLNLTDVDRHQGRQVETS